jgi:hypothetical protein
MSTTYSVYSAYYNTDITSQNILSTWVPRNVPASANDKIITISATYNLRPDLLAYDLYGNASLWWVFAQRNPNALAEDPWGNFLKGLTIYIPDASTLKANLGL